MNEEINVLIVEDEEVWSKTLQITLKELGYVVAGTASNVEDALIAFREIDYDIVLMDINLNGRNSGITLGEIVYKSYNKPFIFITSNSDISLADAKNANPSGYLPKPINSASLFFAIQNAINNFNNKTTVDAPEKAGQMLSSFFVKQGKSYKKIDWNDVSSVSAGKNYVEVFNTRDKSHYYIRSSLQRTLQSIIPPSLQPNFIQINRAEAIQLSHIIEITDNEVKTAHGSFSFTEGYEKELKSKMNLLS